MTECETVVDATTAAGQASTDGTLVRQVIPPRPGSALALLYVELPAHGHWSLGQDRRSDELVYVRSGGQTGRLAGSQTPLVTGSAIFHEGEHGLRTIEAGDELLTLVVYQVGPACDRHAQLGEKLEINHPGSAEVGSATGHRSFRVLFGPENGCCRATMFVGFVPPGAAPWHFHQYDEIVFTVAGEGTYHQADKEQATAPNTAVRIPPRTVHINENTSDSDMVVVGVFTPAGSPAAAYLAPDPRPRR